MSTTAGRPVGITVIAVIGFIQAIIAALVGLGLIVERNNSSLLEHIDRGSDAVTTYGVMALVWGGVVFLVALSLWNGAGWARILIGVLEVLHVAGGVYLLFAWDGHYLWQGAWQILVALFVLFLLFNPRADQFFEGRRA